MFVCSRDYIDTVESWRTKTEEELSEVVGQYDSIYLCQVCDLGYCMLALLVRKFSFKLLSLVGSLRCCSGHCFLTSSIFFHKKNLHIVE